MKQEQHLLGNQLRSARVEEHRLRHMISHESYPEMEDRVTQLFHCSCQYYKDATKIKYIEKLGHWVLS